MQSASGKYTTRRATMDDYDVFLNIMVDCYTKIEPVAVALKVTEPEAVAFVTGFLPHYLSLGQSLVIESAGKIVGLNLVQIVDRPNPIYSSGPDPELPPKIFLIESVAHKLSENFWDIMPKNFTRCFHSLYITTIPSMQLQGAAYTLTKESLRMANDMGVDVAFAEVLSDHVAPVANPFGAFEMRSILHSKWKDREGKPLIKVKGASKSFLQVTFLKKTIPDSKL